MLGLVRLLAVALLAQHFTVVSLAAPVPLVSGSDVWHWHKGTNAPQGNWKTVVEGNLDTTDWVLGRGGFGYSTDNAGELADCQTLLSDMQNHYTTLYLRKSFEVTIPVQTNLHLMLTMDWDDGFIAWLDGNYLTNISVLTAPTEPGNQAVATANHESSRGNTANNPQPAMTFDLGPVGGRLATGTHTLAIMGLNVSSESSDFVQIADLFLETPVIPPSNSISGTITVDTVLYASNSPYMAPGSLTVGNGVTLTIEAGVELQFASGANLTVASTGRLLAEGTTEAPVRFVRPTLTAPVWGGISIHGTVGSPESRLVHAFIEGNGNRCITVTGGTVYMDHVMFGTTNRQYLALDGASFLITDCYFPGSTSGFEPVHGTLGVKAGGRGIIRQCYFGPITGYNDTIDFTSGNRPGPIVQFIDNVFMGTGDDHLDLDSADAWVEGNIFLHIHQNGSPDTASAVSGGNDDGNTGDVTMIGNIFYDCDHAVMCKQGNFYTLINNTIVRQTHAGGKDTEGAVLCLQDNNMTEGRGMYLEGNVIYDVEKLTRAVTNGVVTFQDNLMPLLWSGPGTGNSTTDPMMAYVPQLAETYFTNWAEAQVMKEWFRLRPESPGWRTGPNGADKGGVIPHGVTMSGAPEDTTTETSAMLIIGVNRQGGTIPASEWPNGAGYTHYKWRLDTNEWSGETIITNPIVLTNLVPGAHYVEAVGKNDAGFYQDHPDYGASAAITRTETWFVQETHPSFTISAIEPTGEGVTLKFFGLAGNTYTVQWRASLTEGMWQSLTNVAALVNSAELTVVDALGTDPARYYRVVTPARP